MMQRIGSMSRDEFQDLSVFVNSNFGIKMPDTKKVMVESRLMKRLRALQIDSYSDYFSYVFSKEGQKMELLHMVDVITTNKTDFYREAVHFDFLREEVLPSLPSQTRTSPMKIWSAGCSSGEEAYTIAFTLEEYRAEHKGVGPDYRILGTDLSTRILQNARQAIYTENRANDIPLDIRKKYLLRSKDPARALVKVNPQIRNKCEFRRLNFMDTDYRMKEVFDVVFCRNVLIYFERDVQEQVIRKLCRNLRPGGWFFLGHSESIMRMDLPLKQIRPTIFQKI